MNEQKIAIIFTGQGTQYQGMGNDIRSAFPTAREVYRRAKDILGFYTNLMCFNSIIQKRSFERTDYVQIAIFVTNHALYSVLHEYLPDLKFHATAGHSLGEYNSLVLSKALEFEQALKLVKLRGAYMHKISKDISGGLLAIVGYSDTSLTEELNNLKKKGIYIALLNTERQMVIGGKKLDLEYAKEELKKSGLRISTLNVEGPFHTPYMQKAADYLREGIDQIEVNLGNVPVVANSSARFIIDPLDIKEELYKQIFNPVNWVDSIRRMYEFGIRFYLIIGADKYEVTRGMINHIVRGMVKEIDEKIKIMVVKDERSLENVVNELSK